MPINPFVLKNAEILGVTIKPSKISGKKLDVFKQNTKVASIGASGYEDYHSYIDKKGITYANERRRLYKIRHNKDRKNVGSAGYYSDNILWK